GDAVGRFAREVLNAIERGAGAAGAGAAGRVMLPRFPTVTQKRNYCGPASLELVLRSHGIEVDQDDIAPEVKRDTGSSILAMTRYLESRGLETRRFEGDGARFRACVELGLPVIVEEEYSTTSHVAVVIGVDESLGLLYVQDPMTHVTSERLLKTQGSLGAMYRNAAIVAVKPDDAARRAALDAAGVVDGAHLRLVDGCADDGLRDDLEEVLRRCDGALALVEDYPLAWYRRLQALWAQAMRFRTGNNLARFVVELRRARVRYHDQEWPHLLHAAYLMDDSRFEEALIELENALRVDPHDSNTAQDVAECHMQGGRRDEATAAFWKTLTIDPGHVRATENFTAHALDGGDLELASHLSACALELAPHNPFNHLTASRVAQAEGRAADALVHARRCVEVAPGYVHGALHVASLLTADPSPAAQDEATATYLDLSRKHPYWFEPRWRAARRLERVGAVGDAVELLLAGLEVAQDDPVDLVRPLTEILLEAGDEDGAVEMAERFARERPTVGLLEVLWDTLHAAERHDRARDSTAEFLEANQQSPFAAAQYAFRLMGRDPEQDAEAERLLRLAVGGSPTFHWARRLLTDLLARDRAEEAIATIAAAPGADVANRLCHASLLSDAGRHDEAREVIASLAIDDGWSQDVWNRVHLGDDPAEVALARLGDGGDDEPAHRRRARLAYSLTAGRFADAEAIVAGLPLDDVITQDLLVWACDADDRFRTALRERLGAALVAPTTPYARRRFAAAVLDGDAAAAGDRGPLDARLA
ncbi:MAG: C39 family peptidase, partial [Myxococcales bacterium]|nr:C39 family peptidase [Myxococcales bacterium]